VLVISEGFHNITPVILVNRMAGILRSTQKTKECVAGIVTYCRLDGPGIETWWGWDIQCHLYQSQGPPSLL